MKSIRCSELDVLILLEQAHGGGPQLLSVSDELSALTSTSKAHVVLSSSR